MAKSLIDSGFMPTILAGIRDAYEANQTTGPNKKSSLIFGVMETDYLSVLARLALASPAVFIESVSAVCSGQSQQEAINWLLTEWFSHFDNIGDVNRKKMHALALTRLLSVNGATAPAPSYLLNHLQSYMSIWTDLMTELADGADSQTGGDYLIYWNDEQNGTNGDKFNENEPPEETRRRAWEKADPVFRVNLRQFVGEILTGVIQTSGGVEAFKNEWLVNVDIDVINSFRQYIPL
ncbi:Importin-11 [Ascosphaera atra]|nr:Importin-11 [Ascosphaera atra]